MNKDGKTIQLEIDAKKSDIVKLNEEIRRLEAQKPKEVSFSIGPYEFKGYQNNPSRNDIYAESVTVNHIASVPAYVFIAGDDGEFWITFNKNTKDERWICLGKNVLKTINRT